MAADQHLALDSPRAASTTGCPPRRSARRAAARRASRAASRAPSPRCRSRRPAGRRSRRRSAHAAPSARRRFARGRAARRDSNLRPPECGKHRRWPRLPSSNRGRGGAPTPRGGAKRVGLVLVGLAVLLGSLGGLPLDRREPRDHVAVHCQRGQHAAHPRDVERVHAAARSRADRRCCTTNGTGRSSPRRRRSSASLLGGAIGFGLAVLLAHSRILRRGLLPYIVVSQTVPILAVAPMVVVGLGSKGVEPWVSVSVIAAYLTFFPVAVNTLRGLLSPDPRSLELMRSYAAEPRRRALEAAPARLAAVRVHRAEDLGDRVRDRRDHRRDAGIDPGRPRRRDRQLQPVLLDRSRAALGDEHRLRRRSGSSFFAIDRHRRDGSSCAAHRSTSREREPTRRLDHGRLEAVQGRRDRARRDRPRRSAARVRLADRAFRLRQVDAAADHRRPDRADRRRPSRSTASRPTGRGSTTTTGSSSRRRCSTTGARSRRTSRSRSSCCAGAARSAARA